MNNAGESEEKAMTHKHNKRWIVIDSCYVWAIPISTEIQGLKANGIELSTSFFAREYYPSFGGKYAAMARKALRTRITRSPASYFNALRLFHFIVLQRLRFTDFI